jgi:hypothetical protein
MSIWVLCFFSQPQRVQANLESVQTLDGQQQQAQIVMNRSEIKKEGTVQFEM